MPLVRISKSAKAPRDAAPLAYRRAFGTLTRAIFDTSAEKRLLAAIARGLDPTAAVRSLGWWNPRDPQGPWAAFYARLSSAYTATIEGAGVKALQGVPGASRLRFRVVKADRPPISIGSGRFRADDLVVPPNPRSIAWIKAQAARRVVEVSNEQQELMRWILSFGYSRAERPEVMMRKIRQVVGLTQRQSTAVFNRWAQVNAETGSDELADAAAEKYRDQQIAYRAENIARTENRDATEQGRQDAWLIAQDEGLLPASTKRRWTSLPASFRLCEACEDMDGQTVGLNAPFYSEVLAMEVDRPTLHPSCRCSVVLEFESV